jgi:hypothetical protein
MKSMSSAAAVMRGAVTPGSSVRRARGRMHATTLRVYHRATAGERMLPTILIIGAQKGGTSSLYQYLVDHPAVGRASGKEIQYFTHNAQRGLGWYRAHFPRAGEVRHAIEATPYYIFHPHCPSRVRAALPGVKLIVLLREPVDRAYSHYQMNYSKYGYENLDFRTAIALEDRRLTGEEERMLRDKRYKSFAHQHYSYLARGMYTRQLERWYAEFPRDQILVLCSEHLFNDPARTLHQVQAWLGLVEHTPSTLRPYNARSYDPIDHGFRAELRAGFEPDIARLRDLTGVSLPWG